MSHEIEVKILEINQETIEKKLVHAGGILHFSGEMLAVFYDTPQKMITESGAVLRLRKEGEQAVLAFKTPTDIHSEAKIMEETEVIVSNPEAMQKILKGLGFHEIKTTNKIRREYILPNRVKVVLDQYLGELGNIPVFLEIEAPNLPLLYETVASLGYTKNDCKSWSTYELVKHYNTPQ